MRYLSLTLAVILSIIGYHNSEAENSNLFATPAGIEDEVRFWKTVFGTYDRQQMIIHDARYLNVVYMTLDFSKVFARDDLSGAQKKQIVEEQVGVAKKGISDSLMRIASGVADNSLTDEERYYKKLFKLSRVFTDSDVTSDVYAEAMNNIRVQAGQRSNLISAIGKSAQHMGDIEAIFEAYGLPKELTALIFIESMFNPKAVSNVGASGVWQFMPQTGREYLSINSFWDDRNDPLNASEGAARFLRDIYNDVSKIGSDENVTAADNWALTVNSYNSGPGRLKRAVRELRTKNIATIIHDFNDPDYGFYSRNYYPEFLAVVDVYKNRERYLGSIEGRDLQRYDIVWVAEFANLPDLSKLYSIDVNELRKLNTALSDDVLSGSLPLPPNYPLKVPKGAGYQLSKAIGYK